MNLTGAFELMISKTERSETGCLNYRGKCDRFGYGRLSVWDSQTQKRRKILAHRLAMMAVHGPIASRTLVCHRCDNPRCVEPAHLFLGTHQDNLDDAVQKGRMCREPRASGSLNGKSKLTEIQVIEIKKRLKTGESARVIGISFGVGRTTIAEINRGATWRHVT